MVGLLAVAVVVVALAGRDGAARAHDGDAARAIHSGGRLTALSPHPSTPAVSHSPVTIRATILPTVRAALPRSFLGLSFEYWDLPGFESHPAVLRHVFGLLRVPGDGPVPLRIGGDSADQSFWGRASRIDLGPWPYHLTRHWLHTLASMVRRDHLQVLLDLNLAQQDPEMAARFAHQVVTDLPHRSLMALEIGNEPDIYHHWVDYHLSGPSSLFASSGDWDQYSPSRYAATFRAYSEALERAAPGVPLAGPETAYPLRDLAWERSLIASDRARVAMITIHRYPLTACAHPGARDFSTIPRVLSTRVAAGLQPGLAPSLQLARRARLPVRLTELNSVTCEGRRGVSNTFASALWAPDALFSLWRGGLAGVNIHVRQHATNAAFWMSRSGLRARPLLYGLALFERTLGRRGELARLKVGESSPPVRLWAVRSGRRLNVLALDKGPHPAELVLRIPSKQLGVIQRLTAPSVRATGGVRLAGQTLAPSGRWIGRHHVERVTIGPNGRYRLRVGAYSAALISFRI